MELRHLRYFVAAAEELHFGRAAERLHITQPSLSAQIRRLEEEIGAVLLHRTKRKIQLTEAGLAFYKEARQAIAQAERAVHAARRTSRGECGRLALGFVNAAIYSVLTNILRNVRTRLPEVALTLHELTSEEQTRDLLNDRIDAGLLRPPIITGNLQTMTVYREQFVAALPEGHPLSSCPDLELHALAGYPFLVPPRHGGPTLYDRIMRACHHAGFTPRVTQEADHMQTIISLVAAGFGVAVVPESIQHLRRTGVVYRPLREPGKPIEIAVAWRRDDPSTCLRAFLGIVTDVAASVAGAHPAPAVPTEVGR